MQECAARSRRISQIGSGLASVIAMVSAAAPALADHVVATWDNTTGNWNTASRWSSDPDVPNNTPSRTYDAVIHAGTITLTTPVTIQKLALQHHSQFTTPYQPTITGAADLAVNDLFTWGTGSLTGTGHVYANGGMLINHSEWLIVNDTTIHNAGHATWAGSRRYPLMNGGTINNLAGGTWEAKGESLISGGTFNNAGHVVKSIGSAEWSTNPGSFFGAAFNHASGATVDVQQGGMFFQGGGTGAGSFVVAADAAIGFGGGVAPYELTNTSSVSGAGTVWNRGGTTNVHGTYNVSGGTISEGATIFHPGANVVNVGALHATAPVSFSTGAAHTLSGAFLGRGGILDGADALTLHDATWNGGTFSGAAPLRTTGTTTSTGHQGGEVLGRTLHNAGTWKAQSGFGLNNATLHNEPNARFELNIASFYEGNNGGIRNNGGASKFVNDGTLAKMGTTTAFIEPFVESSGIIEVNSGILALIGGSNITGDIVLGSGTDRGVLQLVGPNHTLTPTSITGSGAMFFAGAATVTGRYAVVGLDRAVGSGTVVGADYSIDFDSGAVVEATGGIFSVGRRAHARFNAGATVHGVGDLLLVNNTATAHFNTGNAVHLIDLLVEGRVTGTDALTVAGTVSGSGTIDNDIVSGGTISPGSSPGTLTINGSLMMESDAELLFELGGRERSLYDLVQVNDEALLGGDLSLAFLFGFESSVAASDIFTLLTATGGLNGGFANVGNGQRLMTENGIGSFLVHFGDGSAFDQNSITLSDFRAGAIPEPASLAVLLVGTTLLLERRRRK